MQLGEVVAWLRRRLGPDTILTNGAGNYAIWANRHFAYHGLGTQLAPTSGSMGYGLPAAVTAKLAYPDRPVVCFAGDGCFLMTGQELATAVQYELPILVIVVDNGMYGTIRMHQEREHPGRISGTPLRNPDFAALARAYGAFGARVESADAFASACEEALACGRPALLHLILDPEAITPRTTLADLRAQAVAAGREADQRRCLGRAKVLPLDQHRRLRPQLASAPPSGPLGRCSAHPMASAIRELPGDALTQCEIVGVLPATMRGEVGQRNNTTICITARCRTLSLESGHAGTQMNR